ncbi:MULTISPECIES: GGDEF domain-containing protein [unclassified Sphingomonas]|uniref:GGDEF domain-containing protein n=1 Tax=unclassified Sphingomonas TaxID=196159 RepID=UPI002269FC39|nr:MULTISPECIES: GGDEF domain-containing protein [unclassified Sphingomonas]
MGKAQGRPKEADDLYDRIGLFLATQGLSAEPEHYRFAYAALADPESLVGQAVARLTLDGVRLTRQDIERLGGSVSTRQPPVRARAPGDDEAERLVAETAAQVDGFATMMQAIREETRDFGADLAQSAASIQRSQEQAGIERIARVASAMVARVRETESRLAQATRETEALRSKLAEARNAARHDALTGLPNRRAFEEAFAARDASDGPWCLAVIDVDRFKQVNDAHGHAVGDRVLSAIGKVLTEMCAGHLVVRHGGEEFAVLLRGVALAQAAEVLDAARGEIAGKRFRSRETGQPLGEVTFSAGVTAVRKSETAETAFARADRLLYAAKAAGRDRVSAG